jgi:ketosteroid isomerase-like protein
MRAQPVCCRQRICQVDDGAPDITLRRNDPAGRATGEELGLRAANLFNLRDGRVSAYEVFPDSAAFVRALAGGGEQGGP